MPIIRNSSSEHTGKKNVREIYSGYRINVQANQLGIPAIPRTIKGPSGDITQSLAEGPLYFSPTELAAILNNNSGSTAPSGPPQPPGPTSIIFSSDTAIAPNLPGSYQIPAGYTRMNYVLIAGGGGGCNTGALSVGYGGGSGGIISVTGYLVTAGTTLSVTIGSGGSTGPPDQFGQGGGVTTLTLDGSAKPAPTGGGGGGPNGGPPTAGSPNGVPNAQGIGGRLALPYNNYGYGGNGDKTGTTATAGGSGFYYIQLYSQAPPPLTFTSVNGTPLPSPYTIPSGYTLLTYVIIGGGGGGGDDGSGDGMGGGSGGITGGIVSIGVVTTISITLGTGGNVGTGMSPNGLDGTATILTLNSTAYANAGGGGGSQGPNAGGVGGTPGGGSGDNSTGEGGYLPSPYSSYGYGGNGVGGGDSATDGRPGYYTITLT